MQFVTWTNPFIHLRDNPRLSTNEGFIPRYISVLTLVSTKNGMPERENENQSVPCCITFDHTEKRYEKKSVNSAEKYPCPHSCKEQGDQ